MIIHGDAAFMILSTALVSIMILGLSFFYGSIAGRKNSLTMIFDTFISIDVVTILWIFGGFGLTFGDDIAGIIGNPAQYFGFSGTNSVINIQYNTNIPLLLFFMYQLMFAITAAAIMTGAYGDKLTISGWIRILILWMIMIYFPVAHWIWGGGFLSKMGFVDYAGGTVIHITSGFGCLGGVYFLGWKFGKEHKDSFNLSFSAVGAALLFLGSFGFISGGSLASADTAAIVFANTSSAISSSMITWTILHYINHKSFSFSQLIMSALSGFIAISPCSGYIRPLSSVFVGVLGSVICFLAVKFERNKFDGSFCVFSIHGIGGFAGTLLAGLFADSTVNGVNGDLGQFLIQLFGSSIVAVYSAVVTYLIFVAADKMKSIRISPEMQKSGLDKSFFTECFNDYKRNR